VSVSTFFARSSMDTSIRSIVPSSALRTTRGETRNASGSGLLSFSMRGLVVLSMLLMVKLMAALCPSITPRRK